MSFCLTRFLKIVMSVMVLSTVVSAHADDVAVLKSEGNATKENGVVAEKVKTFPEQAWAHKNKKVDLLVNGAATLTGDPMSRLLIQDAFARYGIAYDEKRLDVIGSMFTEDAVLEISEGSGKLLVSNHSRDEIVKNMASALTQQADQRRHVISNVTIEQLSGNTAKALAYGIVIVAANGLSIGASVIYSAELRRRADGAWQFSRMFIGMDTYAGNKPR